MQLFKKQRKDTQKEKRANKRIHLLFSLSKCSIILSNSNNILTVKLGFTFDRLPTFERIDQVLAGR